MKAFVAKTEFLNCLKAAKQKLGSYGEFLEVWHIITDQWTFRKHAWPLKFDPRIIIFIAFLYNSLLTRLTGTTSAKDFTKRYCFNRQNISLILNKKMNYRSSKSRSHTEGSIPPYKTITQKKSWNRQFFF